MSAAKKRAIDILADNFDLNHRRKFELIIDEVHLMDLYFKPITRADRLEVQGQAGTDEAMKVSTYMLIRKAENEDGSKAFALGDLANLRRLPEKILNQLELFLFGLDESGNPTVEYGDAKND
jgi:hypothetical protein|tara:strand:- start:131 stop:496 length:366 start_codon:yes stop_codon:yes gene_type:complete